MSFLAPWYVPALAAGLTVPPLVLLYYLKLKRRKVPIASTLLWKRAVHDLQVNSPFQKLRNNLLLILQLLILLAAFGAMSEPMLGRGQAIEKAIVLLIDQSASMSTQETADQDRLAIAKAEAGRIIDEMSTAQRALVIAFADRARVLTPFTDNKAVLHRAVESIENTDAPGRLREAMQLAEAHSTPGEDSTQIDKSHYILLTDGRLEDSADVVVERGSMERALIGQATENVGIVELDVRRDYDRPEQLSVLARVRNFGAELSRRDMSLFVDGQLRNVEGLPELAPLGGKGKLGEMDLRGIPPEGNEAAISFGLVLDTAAEIEVRLSGEDAFAADDSAWAVVTPPQPIRALLVTSGNRYLSDAVDAVIADYDIWSPDEYEEAADDKLIENGRCRYDVVILDGHSTNRLWPGNYLFFASGPLIQKVEVGDTVTGQMFLDWDETHPVLRHVSVDAMTVFSWRDLELPPQAITLIEAATGPVMALLSEERNQYLLCGFGLFDESRSYLNTDWVFQDGFVVFMSNALRHLAGSSTIGMHPSVRPGGAFTVAAKPGTKKVTVRRANDGGWSETGLVRENGLVTFGQTDKVGIYRIDTGIAGEDARAVNLLDETESFIAPNKAFTIAAGELTETEGIDRSRRPIWPYLLVALGVILLVEWIVYNKRVFI